MHINKKHKNILFLVLGLVVLITALIIIYQTSQRETYPSDDPLYGSFTITDKDPQDPIYPTDFLISIDVGVSDETLVKCAEDSNIDISKGCWVYSFDEKKIFRAEKDGNSLQAYEDGKVIGTFEYFSSKILWVDYDEKYTANWRGKELNLTRIMQGFAFP